MFVGTYHSGLTRSGALFCVRSLGQLLLGMAALALFSGVAVAQTTTQYTITDAGVANDITAATSCASPLVQNFSVPTSYSVSDVDIGVIATHSWRGDMRITLQSPLGTRVQVVTGSGGDSGDNFDVRLNDSGTQVVNTDPATGNHNTAAPLYDNNFIPDNALSAFNGENSAGTWRLEICDIFPGADDGNFLRADLFLTDTPASYADLSINKTVSNASPANATSITYTLTVSNAASSPSSATGIAVTDLLPLGVTYTSDDGGGAYNNGSGIWTVGTLTPGSSTSLNIVATVAVTSGTTIINAAEITASSIVDIDSTVGNGANGEDDYDTASFTVTGTRVAGTPPSLTGACSIANQIIFDWDSNSWTSGDLSNNYALAGIGTIDWTVSSPGIFVNDASFGGQSPSLSNANNGGFAGTQLSLHQYLDFANQSQTATTVIDLPTAVPGVQFTVFDIDFAANDFADKLTVTGRFNGATVIPTLTNGVANYVVGNVAIGDAGSGGTSGNGNVVVTFLSPVDEITIVYGNHTTAPSVPDGQAIAIHDITFCAPQTTFSVMKISSVISDPVSIVDGTSIPKSIPGAIMEYCILISNTGSATATDIVATDNFTGSYTYIAESMQSRTNCNAAGTAEDDDASDAGEGDGVTASVIGTLLTTNIAALGPAESAALTFRVTVD
ncbi:proprotein convertase P-domain-containing protein [Parasphingorhabdus sp.]|uniref:proprotein convertase P-domain-containing protein n=1 Tax=Parasphingorhabdus sp. TaxID=2709688 RepID=UPI003298F91C